ncbi:hypothetical protein BD779DRAFT_1685641 [Infundibulicybe gibba]|nr:hypothetical protein BD779DRAFT_1685641 [Infundibulicybe gibba]
MIWRATIAIGKQHKVLQTAININLDPGIQLSRLTAPAPRLTGRHNVKEAFAADFQWLSPGQLDIKNNPGFVDHILQLFSVDHVDCYGIMPTSHIHPNYCSLPSVSNTSPDRSRRIRPTASPTGFGTTDFQLASPSGQPKHLDIYNLIGDHISQMLSCPSQCMSSVIQFIIGYYYGPKRAANNIFDGYKCSAMDAAPLDTTSPLCPSVKAVDLWCDPRDVGLRRTPPALGRFVAGISVSSLMYDKVPNCGIPNGFDLPKWPHEIMVEWSGGTGTTSSRSLWIYENGEELDERLLDDCGLLSCIDLVRMAHEPGGGRQTAVPWTTRVQ